MLLIFVLNFASASYDIHDFVVNHLPYEKKKKPASYSCIQIFITKAVIHPFSNLIIKDLGSNAGHTFFST